MINSKMCCYCNKKNPQMGKYFWKLIALIWNGFESCYLIFSSCLYPPIRSKIVDTFIFTGRSWSWHLSLIRLAVWMKAESAIDTCLFICSQYSVIIFSTSRIYFATLSLPDNYIKWRKGLPMKVPLFAPHHVSSLFSLFELWWAIITKISQWYHFTKLRLVSLEMNRNHRVKYVLIW